MKSLISILLCLVALAWSASIDGESTFYLQNGSVRKGHIVDYNDQVVKISALVNGAEQVIEQPRSKFTRIVLPNGADLAAPTPANEWGAELAPSSSSVSASSATELITHHSSLSASSSSPVANLPNVAVLDFDGSKDVFKKEELQAITTRFETELMKLGVFQVLERRNMDDILKEQGFQQSGACNTSECQVQIGQLLGVERIINGTVTKVKDVITLNVKMVDVGSGKNLMSHALDIQGDLDLVLRGGCYEMAQIIGGKKKPDDSHTVLTAQKASIWPWVIGGVVVVGGGAATYLILNKKTAKVDSYDITP